MDVLIWDSEIRAGEGYGGFLVIEESKDGGKRKKHLPTTKNGKLSRALCAAAWAALFSPGGHRGQPYAGPGKTEAKRKLKAIYAKQGWDTPEKKAAELYLDDTAEGVPMSDLDLAILWGVPNCRAITDAPKLRAKDAEYCGNCNFFKYLPPPSDAMAYTEDGAVEVHMPMKGMCAEHECGVDAGWVCDTYQEWQPEDVMVENKALKPFAIDIEHLAKVLTPIKMVGETRAAGYGVYFARNPREKDVVGTYFTKDTNLGHFYDKAPVLYHHGMVKAFGLDEIANTVKSQVDDVGVWLEIELDRSKAYWKKVKGKIEQGIYYFSGGTAEHLMNTTEGGELKSFPVFEWSITTTPAEWRLGAAQFYKAIGVELDDNSDGDGDGKGGEKPRQKPTDQKRGVRNDETAKDKTLEVHKMDEKERAAMMAEFTAMSNKAAQDAVAALKAENARIEKEARDKIAAEEVRKAEIKAAEEKAVAEYKAKQPADPTQRPGYGRYNVVKEYPMGEFSYIKAIRGIVLQTKGEPNAWSGAEKERDIMHNYANKPGIRAALAEGVGNLGGYLVPPEYMQDQFIPLLRARAVIRGAGPRVLQVKSDTVYIPSQTGGATAAWYGENSTLTESNLTVGQAAINVRKLGALEKISNELLADASPSADQLIREDLAAVVAIKEDSTFFLSDGAAPDWASAPIGMLNYAGTQQRTLAADVGNGGALAIADLQAFKRLMMQANVPFDGMAWFCSPRTWDEISYLRDVVNRPLIAPLMTQNYSQFPEYGNYPEGPETSYRGSVQGHLYGWPVYVTANIIETATKGITATCSYLFFARMSDVVIVERMGLELMATNVAGTSFASDQTWIRAIMREGFGLRHAPAVVWANGLT